MAKCLQIPSLVLGPFGCGKTRTLSECIALLTVHMPTTRLLVCTHSNSAADIYVENLDAKWASTLAVYHKLPVMKVFPCS